MAASTDWTSSGVPCPAGKVLKLERAVYGLKKALATFKAFLTAFFRKQGFTPASDAETVLIKRVGESALIHGMFVDDLLHCTNDKSMYHEFRKAFENEFKIKSQDHVNLYLGIQFQAHHFQIRGENVGSCSALCL